MLLYLLKQMHFLTISIKNIFKNAQDIWLGAIIVPSKVLQ